MYLLCMPFGQFQRCYYKGSLSKIIALNIALVMALNSKVIPFSNAQYRGTEIEFCIQRAPKATTYDQGPGHRPSHGTEHLQSFP